MTLPWILGSREMRHGGAVDGQVGIQPARRVPAGSVRTAACRRRLYADGSASSAGVPTAAWPQAGWRSKLVVEAARPTEQSSASDQGSGAGAVLSPRAVCGMRLCADQLAEHHGCLVSHETLRG